MSTRKIVGRMSEKISDLEAQVDAARTALVHTSLAAIVTLPESDDLKTALNAVMKLCLDAECPTCARIICPNADPLHFHHDGCPACAEAAGEPMS